MLDPTQAGRRKTGGRKAGTPNRTTIIRKMLTVDAVLMNHKKNPIKEVLAMIPLLEPRDQVKTWLELYSYIQAKPKPVEVVVDPEGAPEEDASYQATAELLRIARPPVELKA